MRKLSFILHRILIFLFYNDRRAKKECLPKLRSEKKRNIIVKREHSIRRNFNTPTKADTTGTFWDNVKYFKRSEFACKCGGKYCNGYPAEPKEKLIMVAENVREHFGKAMPVSSGLRCTRHNANVGGVSNSRHLSGKAMDFCVSGVPAATVLSYVKQQKDIRYAIDGSYVHMDIE